MRLDAATATAARPSGTIMRNRSYVLDSSDPETVTRQHPNRGLRTRTRSPSFVAARSPDTNMERSDPLILIYLLSALGVLHGDKGRDWNRARFKYLPPALPVTILGTR